MVKKLTKLLVSMILISVLTIVSLLNIPSPNTNAFTAISIAPEQGPTEGNQETTITGFDFFDIRMTKIVSSEYPYASIQVVYAIDEQGNLYAWGDDYWYYLIGDGELMDNHNGSKVIAPIKLTGLNTGTTYINELKDAKIVDIVVSASTAYAIDDQGNLYAWGMNSLGSIGDGIDTQNHITTPSGHDVVITPKKITGLDTGTTYVNALKDVKVAKVIAGQGTTLAIDTDGNLYAWGGDYRGGVGDGVNTQNHAVVSGQDVVLAPIKLSGLDTGATYINALKNAKIIDVVAGEDNYGGTFLALDDAGNLYAWGGDYRGGVGDGDSIANHNGSIVIAPINLTSLNLGSSSMYVNMLEGAYITKIVAYGMTFYAIDDQGNLYAWGDNWNALVPCGDLTLNHGTGLEDHYVLTPIKITGLDTGSVYINHLKDAKIVDVTGMYAIDDQGELYAWGTSYGIIGNGELTQNHEDGTKSSYVIAPIKLTGLDTGSTYVNELKDVKVRSVISPIAGTGWGPTYAIDTNDNLYVWGMAVGAYGNGYFIGDGKTTSNHKNTMAGDVVITPKKLTELDTGPTYINGIKDVKINSVIQVYERYSVTSFAVDINGNVYAWGGIGFMGSEYLIGDGLLTHNHEGDNPTAPVLAPIKLTGLDTCTPGVDPCDYKNALAPSIEDMDLHVYFDGLEATDVYMIDDEHIHAVTPAHPAGKVDVVVKDLNSGRESTLVLAYEYVDSSTDITSHWKNNNNKHNKNSKETLTFIIDHVCSLLDKVKVNNNILILNKDYTVSCIDDKLNITLTPEYLNTLDPDTNYPITVTFTDGEVANDTFSIATIGTPNAGIMQVTKAAGLVVGLVVVGVGVMGRRITKKCRL